LPRHLDRREFLGTGLRGLAGAALLGTAGGTLLDACSSSSGAPAKRPQTGNYGGTLTMATWSEDNSLSPVSGNWDSTGYLYGNAMFDTLAQIGADGKAHPYLAKSITPNKDYTTWTIEMRPGIYFHDGTLCDGSAVKNSLDAVISGLVTGIALRPVKRTRLVDPMTVAIDMDLPWIPFPAYLASQLGYIAAPAMLKSSDDGGTNPIGTGPFVFESWVPNDHLSVTRNPHYWQKGYPYLDAITFKPSPDPSQRALALRSGAVQLIHTNYPGNVADFLHDSSYALTMGVAPPGSEPSIDFLMLDCGKPPTDNRDLRRALVQALDKDVLRETYGAGIMTLVDSPFPPGNSYWTAGQYPAYDPVAAKQGVSAYTAAHGGPPKIEVSTIPGAEYESVVALVSQEWTAVGVEVTSNQILTSSLITSAVFGNYQALTFEQFGATDPDQNYVWWSTETVGAPGDVSLNLARNSDPIIQRNLETGRSNPDPEARIEAYKAVGEQLSIDCPYIWLGETTWAAIGQPYVTGINGQILPDGSKSEGFSGGVFLLHQVRLNG
jgi:peptide/nickel transport system substrate-binding protein